MAAVLRALETLRRDAGAHFHMLVGEAFERSLPQVMAIYEWYRRV